MHVPLFSFSVIIIVSALLTAVEVNNIVVKEGQGVDLVCNGSGLPSPSI